MSEQYKPRLRNFENASNQRHIRDKDRYLYQKKNLQPKYMINIIGTGTMGMEHMLVASLYKEIQVHGIFDEKKHSLEIAEKEFMSYSNYELKQYSDLESACNDPKADALMICTPNYTHLEVLKVAVLSGKPIFLEKPMATSISDAIEIFNISSNYSSFIQVGLQYRYKAQYVEALHEALSRKVIGKIQTISVSEYRPPFLDKVNQWNKFSIYTGGTLVEKCCHYFDLINLFANSYPKNIYASGGKAVNFLDFKYESQQADIDDHCFVIIEYQNGIRASFTLNMFCPDFNERLILCGDGGRIVASEKFNFKKYDSAKTTISIELGEQDSSRKSVLSYPKIIEQSGHHGSTYYEHNELIRRLEGKSSTSATPLEGLWSMTIASAAQESMASGKKINIKDFLEKNKLKWILDL